MIQDSQEHYSYHFVSLQAKEVASIHYHYTFPNTHTAGAVDEGNEENGIAENAVYCVRGHPFCLLMLSYDFIKGVSLNLPHFQ